MSETNAVQIETESYKVRKFQKERAQTAAQLGAEFVAAVRARDEAMVQNLVAPGSAAAMATRLFGTSLFRLDLRLDDPREQEQLSPFDLQIDPSVALLELAVLVPLKEGEGHRQRLFGSGLLLLSTDSDFGWQVADVIPINSDGAFVEGDPLDEQILAVHQGKVILPLQLAQLDPVEQLFLEQMQGHFNLEELYNAARLWHDYQDHSFPAPEKHKALAAAIEYLITLFDYFKVDNKELARRYSTTTAAVVRRAQEIAQTINVTQFDDRYSIHPDPIAHYKSLFDEIGIDYRDKQQVRTDLLNSKIFDKVAPIPDDDSDFWGS